MLSRHAKAAVEAGEMTGFKHSGMQAASLKRDFPLRNQTSSLASLSCLAKIFTTAAGHRLFDGSPARA